MAQTGSLLPEDGSNKLDNRRQKMEDLLLSYAFTVFNSLTIITYKLQTILQFNNYYYYKKKMGQTYYLLLINIKIEKRKQFRLTFQNFSRLFFKMEETPKNLFAKKTYFVLFSFDFMK